MIEARQDRKAEIQRRMLNAALTLWGMQPNDAAQLDPVVNLLLGACSTELESVYREINAYQSRILERLAQLLVPEVNRGPVPAYAVLKAEPRHAHHTLSTLAQYTYKKPPTPGQPKTSTEQAFYFTPAKPVTLVGAKLVQMIAEGSLYSVEDGLSRQLLAKTTLPPAQAKTLFLGLALHKDVTNLEGLSLYFDWPAHPDPNQDALFLETCQLSLGGVPVPLQTAAALPASQAGGGGVDMHFDHLATHMA